MPGLVVFRRRWSVGSDDLVIPGVFLFVIHFIWIILLVVVLATMDTKKLQECEDQLWQHTLGYVVILVGSCVLEFCIALVAMRGTILEVKPRAPMQYLLYVRLGILLIELVWLVLGVVWLIKYSCENDGQLPKAAVLAIVIFNWVIMLSVVLTVYCTFDSAGRSWVKMKRYQQRAQEESRVRRRSGSTHRNWRRRKMMRAYQDSWNHRCSILFCCMGKSDNSRNTFSDIARLFSEFFRDLDVVPSDVVAGFVLLRKFQKAEQRLVVRQRKDDVYEFLSGVKVTPRSQFLTLSDPVVLEEFKNVVDYMRYALAAYGWPMYLMRNAMKGLADLFPHLSLCACCRSSSNDKEWALLDDNGCQCNIAAMRCMLGTKGENLEIIYATFHVDVGQVAFFVARDHQKKRVVISIRGTLSMKDLITDLTADAEQIPTATVRDDWLAHKGMVQAAEYVRHKLEKEDILNKAFGQGQASWGLVVVGHSLGAGTAAILAILLKDTYPNLTCYSYSPPGGLLSMPVVEYTSSFITSVVLGKDFIPRIGLHQMEALRADLINAIQRSNQPKWKVIGSSVPCCGVCRGREEEMSEEGDSLAEFVANKSRMRSVCTAPTDARIALTMHQPLYPPGRILHVVRSHPTKEQRAKKKEPVYQAVWVNNVDFDEVLISPVMIQDHMPDNVLDALVKVLGESRQILPAITAQPTAGLSYSNPDISISSEVSR